MELWDGAEVGSFVFCAKKYYLQVNILISSEVEAKTVWVGNHLSVIAKDILTRGELVIKNWIEKEHQDRADFSFVPRLIWVLLRLVQLCIYNEYYFASIT